MRIGDKVPTFRAAAVCHGGVRYINSAEMNGMWAIVSFLPRPDSLHGRCMPAAAETLNEDDIRVLFVQPGDSLFVVPPLPKSMILIDPLGLLHRRFGIRRASDLKCRSFVIDPEGILRFQLVHDLNGSGLTMLRELLVTTRSQAGSSCHSR
jgi:alkyl hydroperoxide reductase subunit AhpC